MCVAVPVQIVELDGDKAIVELGGLRRPARVTFIEEPRVGDYVLLHAGFAIRKLPPGEAEATQRLLQDLFAAESPSSGGSPG